MEDIPERNDLHMDVRSFTKISLSQDGGSLTVGFLRSEPTGELFVQPLTIHTEALREIRAAIRYFEALLGREVGNPQERGPAQ